jgi:hypothetical protein
MIKGPPIVMAPPIIPKAAINPTIEAISNQFLLLFYQLSDKF